MNILRSSSQASLRLLSFDESSYQQQTSVTPIKSRVHEDSEHLLHTDTDSDCDSDDHHSECSFECQPQDPAPNTSAVPTTLKFPSIKFKNDNNNIKRNLVRYETILQDDEDTVLDTVSSDESSVGIDFSTQNILQLPNDAQVAIVSFLDLASMQSMMKVNHACRQLIVETDALWKDACQRRWPCISSDQHAFTDKMHIATALTDDAINYATLLSLASDNCPSCVDESMLAPCKWSKRLKRHRPIRAGEDASATISNLDLINKTTVQFSGAVRQGDRCIRANQPLPRPQMLSVQQQAMVAPELSIFEKMNCLSHCYWNGETTKTPVFRPFVSPFLSQNNEIQLTPRLISYFEVTVMKSTEVPKAPSSTAPRPFSLTPQFPPQEAKETEECISIGLALDEFQIHQRMPGWDKTSFGFHGDDGGIYHGSGHMVRDFGATFGPGDTVGCGIDYHKQALFFTKNGEMLGYAFEDGVLDNVIHQDLYPVIGMDSNYPVTCNFGTEKPFQFDLTPMLLEQQEVVRNTIMLQKTEA